MPVMEISVVPVGTKTASISKHVAAAVRVLKKRRLKFELTPMCTVVEGELDELFAAAKEMHETVFRDSGGSVARVLTTIKIDDRKDKSLSMKSKLDSLKKKL
ncbi:MAG: MTH1187 family thiamine-binding protein [Candidatus Norongarragalinales archaeon]